MTTPYNFVTFNNQVPFFDDGDQNTYKGPDDFMDSGVAANAEAFIAWWKSWFDLDDFSADVKFWDGRTMVVSFTDDETTSQITFIFETI